MAAGRSIKAGEAYVLLSLRDQLTKGLRSASKHLTTFGRETAGVGAAVAGVGMAGLGGLAMAAKQYASFDDAIRATGAVSGATGAELKSLSDRARELGATTSFTAVEVAGLMTELGRAGFRPDEINEMTGAVLNLSRATGTDAATSAGIMAATLRQFGLGAADATRASDVLTRAANATFNTVTGLGEAMQYAGPVAASLGMSLEDTTAILGVLGNVGIQGSEAGTALRRLSVIAAGQGDELRQIFGISNVDAAGQMKPLVDILDEINQATSGMSVADRTAKMEQAFGLLGITSANVLSQTAGGVRQLAEDLRKAGGTADKTAEEMDAGLGGSMRILWSAVEAVQLSIGEALSPVLQDLVQDITRVAGGIGEFAKDNQQFVIMLAKGLGIVAGVGAGLLVVGTTALVAGKALAIAAGITSVGFTLLSGAVSLVLSPIGLVAAALAGGAVLWATYTDSGREATGKLKDGLLDFRDIGIETFDGIRDALLVGDLEGAAEIAMAGFGAAWSEGLAKLMENWGGWIKAIVETAAEAFQEIAKLWATTQGAIAETLITASEHDSPMFRGILAGLGLSSLNPDTMLGVDMQAEQERRDRLNRELGLGPENVFDAAREQIDTATAGRVSAIEGRVGEFMSAFGQWADPAALRAAADARRQELADARDRQRLEREAERDRQQELAAASTAQAAQDAATQGVQAAQAVASSGTFSAWAIRGMFGGGQEEQLKEQRATTHELRAIHGVLRRQGLVLVG